MSGVKVSDYIVPMSLSDTYPTNLDIYGKGGIHSVHSLIERDNISLERRSEGMLSYIKDSRSMYVLTGGIHNTNWSKVYNITDSYNLTDIRLDIIGIRRDLDRVKPLYKLDYNKIWIGDSESYAVARSQIGIGNLPVLGAATFPYPSGIPLPAIPMPNPTFNPLSGLDWLMSGAWLPQIFAGSPNTLNTSSETIVSSSLAMTQIKTAQSIKRLDNAGFIVQSRNIDFEWDNPAMSLIPETIRQLYGLSTSYTFTAAQALDELEIGMLKVTQGGILARAVPDSLVINDYVSPVGLQEELIPYVTSATLATTLLLYRTIASYNIDLFPYTELGISTGSAISGAIAAVGVIATNAQNTANDAKTDANSALSKVESIAIDGDVIGSNDSNNVIVSTFAPNPKFTGDYMKIPVSSNDVNIAGTIRFNPTINNIGNI